MNDILSLPAREVLDTLAPASCTETERETYHRLMDCIREFETMPRDQRELLLSLTDHDRAELVKFGSFLRDVPKLEPDALYEKYGESYLGARP